MREHHPMRYHRMTEILKTVASVKLSSTFLLKVSLPKYQTHLQFVNSCKQKTIAKTATTTAATVATTVIITTVANRLTNDFRAIF